MYYTDEFLDQWAEDMDADRRREDEERARADTLVAEDDERRERETLRAQADCVHADSSEEPVGQVQHSGAVEIYLVCRDCGLSRPTGRYDSIL